MTARRRPPTRARGVFDLEATGNAAEGTVRGSSFAADYSMLEASAGVRGGVELWEQLRFEGILGVGWQRVAFDGLPAPDPDPHDSGLGALIGLQVTWAPLQDVALFARATQLTRFPEADSDILDVGVSYAPLSALRVFAGYRLWHEAVVFSTGSSIDLRADGVLVGLEVRL